MSNPPIETVKRLLRIGIEPDKIGDMFGRETNFKTDIDRYVVILGSEFEFHVGILKDIEKDIARVDIGDQGAYYLVKKHNLKTLEISNQDIDHPFKL